jgi:hypothetical protein
LKSLRNFVWGWHAGCSIKLVKTKREDKKMTKHKLEIEHATGKMEKVTVSSPIARILVERLIEKGWPWMAVRVDGHEIVSKPDITVTNKYLAKDGTEIIL